MATNNERSDMLAWINTKLNLNLTNFEQAFSGPILCQLIDSVHPGIIPMHKVYFDEKNENERIENYKILQFVLDTLKITTHIEVAELVKGRHLYDLKFLQGIRSYCDSVSEILTWINSKLKLNLTKFEEAYFGAIICQLLDSVHPGSFWKDKNIDVNELVNGRLLETLKFMQQLKKYSNSIHGDVPNRSVDVVIEAWSSNEEQVRRTVGLLNTYETCFICFESYLRDRMYSAVCGHQFCKSCWEAYIRTSIRNGPECLSLQCPNALCDAAVGRDMIYFMVSDKDKEMYSHYILRSRVEANSKVNCGKCSELYPRSTMFCASCGHLFCTSCLLGYIGKSIHGGPDCLMLRYPEDTCNAAVDQDMVNSIVSDSEKAVYSNYVLRSYIEDNRKGLAQMLTEPTFECYGNCTENFEDDILNLSPGIDAPQSILRSQSSLYCQPSHKAMPGYIVSIPRNSRPFLDRHSVLQNCICCTDGKAPSWVQSPDDFVILLSPVNINLRNFLPNVPHLQIWRWWELSVTIDNNFTNHVTLSPFSLLVMVSLRIPTSFHGSWKILVSFPSANWCLVYSFAE
ncbi:Microtubule-associated protein RP/EB family member [Thalictrum thalictroides]|uniref:RBR-type E3 ubiquitin transferase n=1 Tax=Thalictrum thalictroides TaxID=46969 RepID=A0A7J6X8J0_THATH|nr:Microtubule-associated protein RP/EB family member [Thalictrum thalictroides]